MTDKQHILVVDDEETLCDTLAFNLESEGYDVETAYSAEDALSRDLSRYDLSLLIGDAACTHHEIQSGHRFGTDNILYG